MTPDPDENVDAEKNVIETIDDNAKHPRIEHPFTIHTLQMLLTQLQIAITVDRLYYALLFLKQGCSNEVPKRPRASSAHV